MTESKELKLKAELCLSCDFPTRKANFLHLCNALTKKGYIVEKEIHDMADNRGENEIYVEHNGKYHKVFTSIDPSAKQAIIDSTLDLRQSEVIAKIENIINN
jgi:hypothetical protein